MSERFLVQLIEERLQTLFGEWNLAKNFFIQNVRQPTIILTNLPVPSILFEEIQLPFIIEYSNISKVKCRCGWGIFLGYNDNSPLSLDVEDVEVHLRFAYPSEWSPDKPRERFQRRKRKMLKEWSSQTSTLFHNGVGRFSSDSFGDYILRCLTLHIRNIHLCIFDNHFSSVPFAFHVYIADLVMSAPNVNDARLSDMERDAFNRRFLSLSWIQIIGAHIVYKEFSVDQKINRREEWIQQNVQCERSFSLWRLRRRRHKSYQKTHSGNAIDEKSFEQCLTQMQNTHKKRMKHSKKKKKTSSCLEENEKDTRVESRSLTLSDPRNDVNSEGSVRLTTSVTSNITDPQDSKPNSLFRVSLWNFFKDTKIQRQKTRGDKGISPATPKITNKPHDSFLSRIWRFGFKRNITSVQDSLVEEPQKKDLTDSKAVLEENTVKTKPASSLEKDISTHDTGLLLSSEARPNNCSSNPSERNTCDNTSDSSFIQKRYSIILEEEQRGNNNLDSRKKNQKIGRKKKRYLTQSNHKFTDKSFMQKQLLRSRSVPNYSLRRMTVSSKQDTSLNSRMDNTNGFHDSSSKSKMSWGHRNNTAQKEKKKKKKSDISTSEGRQCGSNYLTYVSQESQQNDYSPILSDGYSNIDSSISQNITAKPIRRKHHEKNPQADKFYLNRLEIRQDVLHVYDHPISEKNLWDLRASKIQSLTSGAKKKNKEFDRNEQGFRMTPFDGIEVHIFLKKWSIRAFQKFNLEGLPFKSISISFHPHIPSEETQNNAQDKPDFPMWQNMRNIELPLPVSLTEAALEALFNVIKFFELWFDFIKGITLPNKIIPTEEMFERYEELWKLCSSTTLSDEQRAELETLEDQLPLYCILYLRDKVQNQYKSSKTSSMSSDCVTNGWPRLLHGLPFLRCFLNRRSGNSSLYPETCSRSDSWMEPTICNNAQQYLKDSFTNKVEQENDCSELHTEVATGILHILDGNNFNWFDYDEVLEIMCTNIRFEIIAGVYPGAHVQGKKLKVMTTPSCPSTFVSDVTRRLEKLHHNNAMARLGLSSSVVLCCSFRYTVNRHNDHNKEINIVFDNILMVRRSIELFLFRSEFGMNRKYPHNPEKQIKLPRYLVISLPILSQPTEMIFCTTSRYNEVQNYLYRLWSIERGDIAIDRRLNIQSCEYEDSENGFLVKQNKDKEPRMTTKKEEKTDQSNREKKGRIHFPSRMNIIIQESRTQAVKKTLVAFPSCVVEGLRLLYFFQLFPPKFCVHRDLFETVDAPSHFEVVDAQNLARFSALSMRLLEIKIPHVYCIFSRQGPSAEKHNRNDFKQNVTVKYRKQSSRRNGASLKAADCSGRTPVEEHIMTAIIKDFSLVITPSHFLSLKVADIVVHGCSSCKTITDGEVSKTDEFSLPSTRDHTFTLTRLPNLETGDVFLCLKGFHLTSHTSFKPPYYLPVEKCNCESFSEGFPQLNSLNFFIQHLSLSLCDSFILALCWLKRFPFHDAKFPDILYRFRMLTSTRLLDFEALVPEFLSHFIWNPLFPVIRVEMGKAERFKQLLEDNIISFSESVYDYLYGGKPLMIDQSADSSALKNNVTEMFLKISSIKGKKINFFMEQVDILFFSRHRCKILFQLFQMNGEFAKTAKRKSNIYTTQFDFGLKEIYVAHLRAIDKIRLTSVIALCKNTAHIFQPVNAAKGVPLSKDNTFNTSPKMDYKKEDPCWSTLFPDDGDSAEHIVNRKEGHQKSERPKNYGASSYDSWECEKEKIIKNNSTIQENRAKRSPISASLKPKQSDFELWCQQTDSSLSDDPSMPYRCSSTLSYSMEQHLVHLMTNLPSEECLNCIPNNPFFRSEIYNSFLLLLTEVHRHPIPKLNKAVREERPQMSAKFRSRKIKVYSNIALISVHLFITPQLVNDVCQLFKMYSQSIYSAEDHLNKNYSFDTVKRATDVKRNLSTTTVRYKKQSSEIRKMSQYPINPVRSVESFETHHPAVEKLFKDEDSTVETNSHRYVAQCNHVVSCKSKPKKESDYSVIITVENVNIYPLCNGIVSVMGCGENASIRNQGRTEHGKMAVWDIQTSSSSSKIHPKVYTKRKRESFFHSSGKGFEDSCRNNVKRFENSDKIDESNSSHSYHLQKIEYCGQQVFNLAQVKNFVSPLKNQSDSRLAVLDIDCIGLRLASQFRFSLRPILSVDVSKKNAKLSCTSNLEKSFDFSSPCQPLHTTVGEPKTFHLVLITTWLSLSFLRNGTWILNSVILPELRLDLRMRARRKKRKNASHGINTKNPPGSSPKEYQASRYLCLSNNKFMEERDKKMKERSFLREKKAVSEEKPSVFNYDLETFSLRIKHAVVWTCSLWEDSDFTCQSSKTKVNNDLNSSHKSFDFLETEGKCHYNPLSYALRWSTSQPLDDSSTENKFKSSIPFNFSCKHYHKKITRKAGETFMSSFPPKHSMEDRPITQNETKGLKYLINFLPQHSPFAVYQASQQCFFPVFYFNDYTKGRDETQNNSHIEISFSHEIYGPHTPRLSLKLNPTLIVFDPHTVRNLSDCVDYFRLFSRLTFSRLTRNRKDHCHNTPSKFRERSNVDYAWNVTHLSEKHSTPRNSERRNKNTFLLQSFSEKINSIFGFFRKQPLFSVCTHVHIANLQVMVVCIDDIIKAEKFRIPKHLPIKSTQSIMHPANEDLTSGKESYDYFLVIDPTLECSPAIIINTCFIGYISTRGETPSFKIFFNNLNLMHLIENSTQNHMDDEHQFTMMTPKLSSLVTVFSTNQLENPNQLSEVTIHSNHQTIGSLIIPFLCVTLLRRREFHHEEIVEREKIDSDPYETHFKRNENKVFINPTSVSEEKRHFPEFLQLIISQLDLGLQCDHSTLNSTVSLLIKNITLVDNMGYRLFQNIGILKKYFPKINEPELEAYYNICHLYPNVNISNCGITSNNQASLSLVIKQGKAFFNFQLFNSRLQLDFLFFDILYNLMNLSSRFYGDFHILKIHFPDLCFSNDTLITTGMASNGPPSVAFGVIHRRQEKTASPKTLYVTLPSRIFNFSDSNDAFYFLHKHQQLRFLENNSKDILYDIQQLQLISSWSLPCKVSFENRYFGSQLNVIREKQKNTIPKTYNSHTSLFQKSYGGVFNRRQPIHSSSSYSLYSGRQKRKWSALERETNRKMNLRHTKSSSLSNSLSQESASSLTTTPNYFNVKDIHCQASSETQKSIENEFIITESLPSHEMNETYDIQLEISEISCFLSVYSMEIWIPLEQNYQGDRRKVYWSSPPYTETLFTEGRINTSSSSHCSSSSEKCYDREYAPLLPDKVIPTTLLNHQPLGALRSNVLTCSWINKENRHIGTHHDSSVLCILFSFLGHSSETLQEQNAAVERVQFDVMLGYPEGPVIDKHIIQPGYQERFGRRVSKLLKPKKHFPHSLNSNQNKKPTKGPFLHPLHWSKRLWHTSGKAKRKDYINKSPFHSRDIEKNELHSFTVIYRDVYIRQEDLIDFPLLLVDDEGNILANLEAVKNDSCFFTLAKFSLDVCIVSLGVKTHKKSCSAKIMIEDPWLSIPIEKCLQLQELPKQINYIIENCRMNLKTCEIGLSMYFVILELYYLSSHYPDDLLKKTFHEKLFEKFNLCTPDDEWFDHLDTTKENYYSPSQSNHHIEEVRHSVSFSVPGVLPNRSPNSSSDLFGKSIMEEQLENERLQLVGKSSSSKFNLSRKALKRGYTVADLVSLHEHYLHEDSMIPYKSYPCIPINMGQGYDPLGYLTSQYNDIRKTEPLDTHVLRVLYNLCAHKKDTLLFNIQAEVQNACITFHDAYAKLVQLVINRTLVNAVVPLMKDQEVRCQTVFQVSGYNPLTSTLQCHDESFRVCLVIKREYERSRPRFEFPWLHITLDVDPLDVKVSSGSLHIWGQLYNLFYRKKSTEIKNKKKIRAVTVHNDTGTPLFLIQPKRRTLLSSPMSHDSRQSVFNHTILEEFQCCNTIAGYPLWFALKQPDANTKLTDDRQSSIYSKNLKDHKTSRRSPWDKNKKERNGKESALIIFPEESEVEKNIRIIAEQFLRLGTDYPECMTFFRKYRNTLLYGRTRAVQTILQVLIESMPSCSQALKRNAFLSSITNILKMLRNTHDWIFIGKLQQDYQTQRAYSTGSDKYHIVVEPLANPSGSGEWILCVGTSIQIENASTIPFKLFRERRFGRVRRIARRFQKDVGEMFNSASNSEKESLRNSVIIIAPQSRVSIPLSWYSSRSQPFVVPLLDRTNVSAFGTLLDQQVFLHREASADMALQGSSYYKSFYNPLKSFYSGDWRSILNSKNPSIDSEPDYDDTTWMTPQPFSVLHTILEKVTSVEPVGRKHFYKAYSTLHFRKNIAWKVIVECNEIPTTLSYHVDKRYLIRLAPYLQLQNVLPFSMTAILYPSRRTYHFKKEKALREPFGLEQSNRSSIQDILHLAQDRPTSAFIPPHFSWPVPFCKQNIDLRLIVHGSPIECFGCLFPLKAMSDDINFHPRQLIHPLSTDTYMEFLSKRRLTGLSRLKEAEMLPKYVSPRLPFWLHVTETCTTKIQLNYYGASLLENDPVLVKYIDLYRSLCDKAMPYPITSMYSTFNISADLSRHVITFMCPLLVENISKELPLIFQSRLIPPCCRLYVFDEHIKVTRIHVLRQAHGHTLGQRESVEMSTASNRLDLTSSTTTHRLPIFLKFESHKRRPLGLVITHSHPGRKIHEGWIKGFSLPHWWNRTKKKALKTFSDKENLNKEQDHPTMPINQLNDDQTELNTKQELTSVLPAQDSFQDQFPKNNRWELRRLLTNAFNSPIIRKSLSFAGVGEDKCDRFSGSIPKGLDSAEMCHISAHNSLYQTYRWLPRHQRKQLREIIWNCVSFVTSLPIIKRKWVPRPSDQLSGMAKRSISKDVWDDAEGLSFQNSNGGDSISHVSRSEITKELIKRNSLHACSPSGDSFILNINSTQDSANVMENDAIRTQTDILVYKQPQFAKFLSSKQLEKTSRSANLRPPINRLKESPYGNRLTSFGSPSCSANQKLKKHQNFHSLHYMKHKGFVPLKHSKLNVLKPLRTISPDHQVRKRNLGEEDSGKRLNDHWNKSSGAYQNSGVKRDPLSSKIFSQKSIPETVSLSVTVRYAAQPYHMSKIITFGPRYMFFSQLPFKIILKDFATSHVYGRLTMMSRLNKNKTNCITLCSGECAPFHTSQKHCYFEVIKDNKVYMSPPFPISLTNVPVMFQIPLRLASDPEVSLKYVIQINAVSGTYESSFSSSSSSIPYTSNVLFFILSLSDYLEYRIRNVTPYVLQIHSNRGKLFFFDEYQKSYPDANYVPSINIVPTSPRFSRENDPSSKVYCSGKENKDRKIKAKLWDIWDNVLSSSLRIYPGEEKPYFPLGKENNVAVKLSIEGVEQSDWVTISLTAVNTKPTVIPFSLSPSDVSKGNVMNLYGNGAHGSQVLDFHKLARSRKRKTHIQHMLYALVTVDRSGSHILTIYESPLSAYDQYTSTSRNMNERNILNLRPSLGKYHPDHKEFSELKTSAQKNSKMTQIPWLTVIVQFNLPRLSLKWRSRSHLILALHLSKIEMKLFSSTTRFCELCGGAKAFRETLLSTSTAQRTHVTPRGNLRPLILATHEDKKKTEKSSVMKKTSSTRDYVLHDKSDMLLVPEENRSLRYQWHQPLVSSCWEEEFEEELFHNSQIHVEAVIDEIRMNHYLEADVPVILRNTLYDKDFHNTGKKKKFFKMNVLKRIANPMLAPIFDEISIQFSPLIAHIDFSVVEQLLTLAETTIAEMSPSLWGASETVESKHQNISRSSTQSKFLRRLIRPLPPKTSCVEQQFLICISDNDLNRPSITRHRRDETKITDLQHPHNNTSSVDVCSDCGSCWCPMSDLMDIQIISTRVKSNFNYQSLPRQLCYTISSRQLVQLTKLMLEECRTFDTFLNVRQGEVSPLRVMEQGSQYFNTPRRLLPEDEFKTYQSTKKKTKTQIVKTFFNENIPIIGVSSYLSHTFLLPNPLWAELKEMRPFYIKVLRIRAFVMTISIRTSSNTINRNILHLVDALPLDTPYMRIQIGAEERNCIVCTWGELLHSLRNSYLKQLIRQTLPSAWLFNPLAFILGIWRGIFALVHSVVDESKHYNSQKKMSIEGAILGFRLGSVKLILYTAGGFFQTLSHIANILHKAMGGSRKKPRFLLDALWKGLCGLFRDTFITPWVALYKAPYRAYSRGDNCFKIGLIFFACLVRCIFPFLGVLHFITSVSEGLANVLIGDFEQYAGVRQSLEL